jgi:hypothetical protein
MRRYFFLGVGIVIDLALFLSHKIAHIDVATAEYVAIILLGAFIDNMAHLHKSSEDLKERVDALDRSIKADETALGQLRGEVLGSNANTLREMEQRSEQVLRELGSFHVALRGLDSQLMERVDGLRGSYLTSTEELRRLRDTLRDGDDIRKTVLDVRENYSDLDDHLRHLLARLADMAIRGTVAVERRSDVYAEDRRLIDKLVVNQELGSCCYVQEDPRRQLLEDQDFIAFIQTQVRASLRGVQVKRVYICESEADARRQEFHKHLVSLKTRIEADGRLSNFEVRCLILETLDKQLRGEFRIDVLLFGNNRVSEGDLSQLSQMLLRAEYRSDEQSVREAKNKFFRVFNSAMSLDEFLRGFLSDSAH